MSRLRVAAEQRPPEYTDPPDGIGANMTRLMAISPVVLPSYLTFRSALDGGTLSPRLRAQIALTVGATNRCGYCLSAHSANATLAGLEPVEIEAAREAQAEDPKVEAALAFARKVVEYRGEITDNEFNAVRLAGYTDAEIVEIIANIVLNIYTNYFNSIVQTDMESPPPDLLLDHSS